MSKPKLNQIVAVCYGKKTNVEKVVTEAYQKLQKADLFSGLSRTYTPLDESGEALPGETKYPQAKVSESVEVAVQAWTSLMDIVATQDKGNTQAKANLVVDGKMVLQDVPVTHLLFLEKQLLNVQAFVTKLPVLDPAEQWSFDDAKNLYKTDVVVTNRNLKKPMAFVKSPATDKHPAQVDVFMEEVNVGKWNTVKFSGCIEAKYKQEVLNRVKSLLEAVKVAREEANSLEVEKVQEGEKLLSFIFE